MSEGALSGASVFQGEASDPDGDGLTYSMQQINLNTQLNPDFVISSRYGLSFSQSVCLLNLHGMVKNAGLGP